MQQTNANKPMPAGGRAGGPGSMPAYGRAGRQTFTLSTPFHKSFYDTKKESTQYL